MENDEKMLSNYRYDFSKPFTVYEQLRERYLNAEEISYSLTVSDTVYLNEPVTIKGVINQDLDIRVYWENWNNDHLIGVLKPYRESIVWIPENIKEGPANLLTQIAYKSGRKNQTNLMGGKNIVIKKR